MAIHKRLTAIGFLIKDAQQEVNEQSNNEYISFAVSVYDGKSQNNESKSQLINVYWSGEYANNTLPKLLKGAKVLVEGEVKSCYYQNKRDGNIVPTLTINYPSNVQILSEPKENTSNKASVQPRAVVQDDYSSLESDDIPF